MNDIVLLMLDVQDNFLKVLPKRDHLLQRCCFAIEVAVLLDIKMIYVEQVPEKLGETNKFLIERGLNKAQYFSKTSFSAFGADGFLDFLHHNELNHLLVAGLETSICIYQTVLDAIRYDFDVTVLSDCVASRREEDSYSVSAALQKSNCYQLPSETVFYSLLQSSENLKFKEFNNIVKKYS